MLIGVVSDTHGQLVLGRAAVRMLENLKVERVLHCGDIGSAEIVYLFAAWPTHFVYGNVDYDRAKLRAAIKQAGQTCHDGFGVVEYEGRKIALLHGDDTRKLDETILCGQYDLVCHGHTHVAAKRNVGKTLVLNPGAVFRANPHSIAVVELPAVEATIVPID
jgi:putative phosphoesterase